MKFWSRYSAAADSWDNEVWFFDFKSRQLKKRSTRKLFAREGLNTPEVEARLGRVIESPLAGFAHDDMRDRKANAILPDSRKIDNPDVLRAVALVFMVQSARGLDGIGHTVDSVAAWMKMSDEQLGWFADVFWRGHRIATFAVPREVTLFLPEAGWYAFPVFDQKIGPTWCSALPLNPRIALVAVPRDADLPYTDDTIAALSNFSVGLPGNGSRVIVPTASIDTHGAAALEAAIPSMRDDAMQLTQTIEKMRSAVATAYQLIGLDPPASMPNLRRGLQSDDGDGT